MAGVAECGFRAVRETDVAVLVTDRVADFGFATIPETFKTANTLLPELESPPPPWRLRTVSLGASVRSAHGHLVPTTPLRDLGGEIDMVIVPATDMLDTGGLADIVAAPSNRPLLEWISMVHQRGAHLAAACTGTFFLAEAGALDGVAATSSWWLGPTFRRMYPKVHVREGRTLCHGKGVTTAGAVLSHLDLALSLIGMKSPTLAETVATAIADRGPQLEYPSSEAIARDNSLVTAFERWVRERIADQFAITDAARALSVTMRSLQRATHAELGMSPRDFVDEVRLERATVLLRTTTLSMRSPRKSAISTPERFERCLDDGPAEPSPKYASRRLRRAIACGRRPGTGAPSPARREATLVELRRHSSSECRGRFRGTAATGAGHRAARHHRAARGRGVAGAVRSGARAAQGPVGQRVADERAQGRGGAARRRPLECAPAGPRHARVSEPGQRDDPGDLLPAAVRRVFTSHMHCGPTLLITGSGPLA
jgi:transcriptional regulator GlxA family with amidase domain